MRRLAVTAVLAALAFAGCGGSDDGETPAGDPRDLISRLPAAGPDRDSGSYTDLLAARKQLGLPNDADIAGFEPGAEGELRPLHVLPAELRLANAAGLNLAYLALPADTPIASALDSGAIEEAASSVVLGGGAVNVIRTSQPFDEISDSLAEDGYERRGELLVADGVLSSIVYRAVADAGDGVIVLAGSEEAAQAALDTPEDVSGSRRTLLELPGAQRVVGRPLGQSCITSVSVWSDLGPPEGELVFGVEGDASADAVKIDDYSPLGPEADAQVADFGDPEDEGSTVRVPYEYDPSELSDPVLRLLAGDIPLDEIYDCG